MAHPRRSARRAHRRRGLTHSGEADLHGAAGPRGVARADVAAAASPYGLDLRDDSRATHHRFPDGCFHSLPSLTDNPVLRRPLESGQYVPLRFGQKARDAGIAV